MFRFALACALFLLLAGCGAGPRPVVASGSDAYAVVPEGDVMAPRRTEIAPNDELSIAVFREPDLSLEKAIVDSDGRVQVPLLGSVDAAGLTAGEFSRRLEELYGARYLVNPSVSVALVKVAQQQVTVTGAVTQPGVYPMPSRISLVDAVALAQGPTNVARYNQVVVFRRAGGQRVGGVFDLGRISAGIDRDVEIVPGDQVIVGTDELKVLYRDVLQAAPLIGLFRFY